MLVLVEVSDKFGYSIFKQLESMIFRAINSNISSIKDTTEVV